MATYRLYPDSTELIEGAKSESFRLTTVNARLGHLSAFIERDKEKLYRKHKRHKNLTKANAIPTAIGVACLTVGGSLNSVGIGVIAGGRLIGIGVACGVGALVILRLGKASNYSAYEELATLGQAKLSFPQKRNLSISESECEFRNLVCDRWLRRLYKF